MPVFRVYRLVPFQLDWTIDDPLIVSNRAVPASRRHSARRVGTALTILAAVTSLACGGDGGGGPGPSPTTLAKGAGNNGDNQVGLAGLALATPLAVRVTDQSGQPVANVAVSWAVGTGGGSVSSASTNTDASGIALVTRTLGPNAGTQTTTASRSGATGSPVTFTAIAQIQGATQIALNPGGSGTGQTDTVRTTLGTTYKVLVREQTNAPVQGVTVQWAAANANSGTVSSATSTTNASGVAEITHTFGQVAGAQSVTATVTGLMGSPVTFTSTATAGNAASIEIAGGTPATGSINTAVSTPYSVRAEDAYGNPRQGVTVNWAIQTGSGGSLPTPSTTGTNGIATSTRTLGPAAGTYVDTATATGLTGSPLLFTVTATTAPATAEVSVADNSFNPSSVTIGAGGTVTWTWSGGNPHNVTFQTPPPQGNCGTITSGNCPRTFPNSGTFTYRCTIHAGMDGSVTVVP